MGDPYYLLSHGLARTEWEAEVARGLRTTGPALADLGVPVVNTNLWQHEDGDGRQWLMAHIDISDGQTALDALRVDIDVDGYRGGFSKQGLNGDHGVPAREAGISFDPPTGVEADPHPDGAVALGTEAGEWMVYVVERTYGGPSQVQRWVRRRRARREWSVHDTARKRWWQFGPFWRRL